MIDATPVSVQLIPFIGDGSSVGIGNDAGDALLGQQEMISGPVGIQYSHIAHSPISPKFVEHAGIPGFPVGVEVHAAQSPKAQMYQRHDAATHEPFRLVDRAGPHAAPPISTGDVNVTGRP